MEVFIIFLISLALLLKSADLFTASSEKIGVSLGLPRFIIGVTLVALGTSLPELVSSVIAVIKGSSEIVVANVIGSNITNIFLIIGVAALVAKNIRIKYELIRVDLPLLVGSAFFLLFIAWDGVVDSLEGALALIGMGLYLFYAVSSEKKHEHEGIAVPQKTSLKDGAVLIISAVVIYISAEYVVDSIIEMAERLGVGTDVITTTMVALGTSLPELIVSIDAARKNKPEIAVGNILGSNIFNAFAVVGVPALIGNLTITPAMLSFALPFMIGATLLYFFITQDKQITRWEGYLLLIFYLYFIITIIKGG